MTFETYLRKKHYEQYTGDDENMEDNFNFWVATFTTEDWLCHGQLYGEYIKYHPVGCVSSIFKQILSEEGCL